MRLLLFLETQWLLPQSLERKPAVRWKKCNIMLSCWYLGLKKEIRKIFGVCVLSLLPTLHNKLSYIYTSMS